MKLIHQMKAWRKTYYYQYQKYTNNNKKKNTNLNFLLTAAILTLICFCRISGLVFSLYLIFLFTQCYYISIWNEVFHIIEVLKYLKLILTAPATNAMSERLCSTLRRIKIHLRSSMTQELLRTSCYL